MIKRYVALALLGLVFLGVYAYIVTPLPSGTAVSARFDWPDETANYFWIRQYAQTEQLRLAEPLNQAARNQIHPRSFNVLDDGSLVPGSFLGLILLYGTIVKIIGQWSIIYLTPIFSVGGVLAFYGIVKRIFDQRVAWVSAVLLFVHPAWWYYSVTSLLPNIAFVSLLLISWYFLLKSRPGEAVLPQFGKVRPVKIVYSEITAAALAGGLALAIRPAELVWLLVVYIVVFLYVQSRLTWGRVVTFIAVVVLLLLPSLHQQQLLYGNWLHTGYSQLQVVQSGDQSACDSCAAAVGVAKSFFAPFGVHPALIASNVWNHLFARLWLWSLLAALGLAALVTSRQKRSEPVGYLLVGMAVAIFLAVYYGSWQFTDLLTLNLNTLGISYVRYWLPLYVFSVPLVAIAIIFLSRLVPRRFAPALVALVIAGLAYQSGQLVLMQKADSIIPVKQRIVEYKQTANTIIAQTESDAIIVTVRKDKVFFPERKVIHTFDALTINRELSEILSSLVVEKPVYYFALGPEPQTTLAPDMRLELVSELDSGVLYKIVKRQE